MTVSRIVSNPYAAAGLGAAATLAAQNLGPIALASGWIAPACSVLLAAAAVGVLAHEGLFAGRSEPAISPPLPPLGDAKAWSLPQKPSDWLFEMGALTVPDGDVEGFLRARLAGTLSTMPQPVSGRWEAPLPEPIALLALAFAARAAGRDAVSRDVGSTLLAGLCEAMAQVPGHGRHAAFAALRDRIAGELDRNGFIARAYLRAMSLHGTRESVMMGLLAEGRRRSGVLASAEFVWLKAVDRPLWYALNNLGRRHFHVEGIAAVAHYRTETLAKRAFVDPQVDDAIESLAALCRDLRRDGLRPSEEGMEDWV